MSYRAVGPDTVRLDIKGEGIELDCTDLTHVRGQIMILTGDTTGLIIGFKYSVSPKRQGTLYENGTADRFTGLTATGGTVSSSAIDVRGFGRIRMEVITAASTASVALGLMSMLGYTPNTLFGNITTSGAGTGTIAGTDGGGAGGGGGCVSADTMILTDAGYREGRYVSGRVWTLDQHDLQPGVYDVESVEVVKNQGCDLHFSDGRKLRCSINHRVRKADSGEWVEAESLKVGDCLEGIPKATLAREPEQCGEIDVVKVSVKEARTYIADGVLCHNDKGGPA